MITIAAAGDVHASEATRTKLERPFATLEELIDRGATFLNGPVDRPWGRRTAAFADPAGNVWEIAEELPES